MHISQFLLLTFTVMVAIVIPGCSSKSDDSTTTTTTTDNAYTQDEFDTIASNLATLVDDDLFEDAVANFVLADTMGNLNTAFTDLSTKSATNLNDALEAMAAQNTNAMSVYVEMLDNLKDEMNALSTQSGSSFAQAYGSNGAASTTSLVQVQTTTYGDFCDIGKAFGVNSLDSITAATVWQSVDIEAISTTSPSNCLSDSFSDAFMTNFSLAVYACTNKDTTVATVVTGLQTAFDALNKTIVENSASLTNYDVDTNWDTDRTAMQADLTALAEMATTYVDPFLLQSNTSALLTQSCDYNADMQARMKATCDCFDEALQTTTAIIQLLEELSGWYEAQAVNFQTWSWNNTLSQENYGNEDLSYTNNSEYICNQEWDLPLTGVSYQTCEDAVASFGSR